jgi:hypothetical protein
MASTLGCSSVWGARHARRWAPFTLAAVLAGCGGGYTKSDFVARADAICASALRQTRSIPPGADLGGYLAAVLAVVQSEATQLRALRRPPDTAGDRATLEQYFAALGQTVSDYRQLAAAAQNGDQQKWQVPRRRWPPVRSSRSRRATAFAPAARPPRPSHDLCAV